MAPLFSLTLHYASLAHTSFEPGKPSQLEQASSPLPA